MADVRLTATNPEDSSVVPVACDASGRLLLQELPPAFDGTVDGDLTVTGKGTFAAGKSIIGNDGSAQFAQGAVDIYANGKVEFTQDVTFDGSAEFAGVIDALYFESVRDSSAQTCFASYLAPDTSNSTFKVTADGSATFAGSVKAESLSAESALNDTWFRTGSNLAGQDYIWAGKNNDAGAWNSGVQKDGKFVLGDLGTNTYNVQLNAVDGSAGFATGKITFDADGSAEFAGAVDAQNLSVTNQYTCGNINISAPNNSGAEISAGGSIVIQAPQSSAADSKVFKIVYASEKVSITNTGSATFAGDITANNVTFNLEPDNPDNYITTTEEYTVTEYYTVEVPVVERPGVGTADIQDGVSTADLVDGDERETKTITKSREVTKTREVKTYTGPTMEVKEELLALRERAAQQDAIIAQMTEALKKLGADIDPPAETKTTRKKR